MGQSLPGKAAGVERRLRRAEESTEASNGAIDGTSRPAMGAT
jgi:hypothetical protein